MFYVGYSKPKQTRYNTRIKSNNNFMIIVIYLYSSLYLLTKQIKTITTDTKCITTARVLHFTFSHTNLYMLNHSSYECLSSPNAAESN